MRQQWVLRGRLTFGPAIGLAALAGWLVIMALIGGPAVTPVQATNHSAPTAELAIDPNPAHPGETVLVDATNSSDPDGEAVSCMFDLDDDGKFERETRECRFERRFDRTGEYPITVRLSDPSGQSNETMETLVVAMNDPPTARLSHDPAFPDPGVDVRFDAAASTDEDGRIVEFRWNLDGDGEIDHVDGPILERVFETTGNYSIALTVVDDDGATNTTTITVPVEENQPPTAMLSVNAETVDPGEVLQLEAGGSADSDGRIVEWAFDLGGDGTFERVTDRSSIRVTYNVPGEYEVGIRVTDDDGATATTTSTIVVRGTPTSTPTSASTPKMQTVVRTVVVTAGAGDDLPGGKSLLPSFAKIREIPGIVGDDLPAFIAVVLVLLTILTGVAVSRQSAVREHARAIARKVKRQLTSRKLAARLGKKLFKKGLRKVGEAVENGGQTTGQWIEKLGRRIGDTVERITKRVGQTFKRWGA